MTRDDAIAAILAERQRQIEKWGERADDFEGKPWLAILTEEVGEVAKATMDGDGLEAELVQVAAVCVKWLENIRRG